MPAEEAMGIGRSFIRSLTVAAVVAVAATACGSGNGTSAANSADNCTPKAAAPAITTEQVANANVSGTTIKLLTHDSFAVSPGVLEQFQKDTGIKVDVIKSGDAGQLVSRAVLTAGKPEADVLYGIDNTFLCRGVAAGVFQPYESPALSNVPQDLHLAPDHLLSPIDYGDVCVNYALDPKGTPAPTSLDDLTKPAWKDKFVTENPDTSSPGLAFLLATIAKYGDNGWQDYWRKLRANGVQVTSGWSQAYDEAFGDGNGSRTAVTSYATSPAADVVYSDPKIDTPNTAVLTDGCFRQVEFAGVLRGTSHPEAAAKLVDFLLAKQFQEDIPLNMFVYPSNKNAALPDVFVRWSAKVDKPYMIDPKTIEANVARWTDEWTQTVLR
jgi:thiamine transport system substrate-binding protein